MKRANVWGIILISIILLPSYILPYWFIIKESAASRSKFKIKRLSFSADLTYRDQEMVIKCTADFTINNIDRLFDSKLDCDNLISEFKFKDSKLFSQQIKSKGKYFAKFISHLAENGDLILPLPISSENLRNRICHIVNECSYVKYKRLAGTINYQFLSRESGNYYMVDKESFLPTALFIKDKNINIEAKKYYNFSTNIKFPSVIELQIEKQYVILNIEEVEVE
ncbi:MAG: hypothetical protein N2746_10230 [Deltaproteobacteria bacterium]|nr:hypothetical protein [Deltaproteobacteria bacterium]